MLLKYKQAADSEHTLRSLLSGSLAPLASDLRLLKLFQVLSLLSGLRCTTIGEERRCLKREGGGDTDKPLFLFFLVCINSSFLLFVSLSSEM